MGWTVCKEGFARNDIVCNGNKFIIGNGYMGFRGTMEEYTRDQLVALNLAGIYDKNGGKWREPVNAPNGFYTILTVDGKKIGLPEVMPVFHVQKLDIRNGLHSRDTVWFAGGGKVKVSAQRFLSLSDFHLMCLKYTVLVEKSCELVIKTGIDGDVWDINGPHLKDYVVEGKEDFLRLSAMTGELNIPVVVSEVCHIGFKAEKSIERGDKGIFHIIKINAEPGVKYSIYKYVSVFTGNDSCADICDECARSAQNAAFMGFDSVFEMHRESWNKRWEASDVIIEGNDDDQLALRYSIYQLQIIAPAHIGSQSIPARGLSGQTYKGAVFWDTEMFMFPFFLHTAPDVAKRLINYRIKTLDGARRKAAYYGYRGAFYAWESQEKGDDACSDFNVTDVFTNRPVRTYFKDKQIHISADVAYAIWEYYEFTGDIELLINGGAEVILECARFFYSYAYYKEDRDRYEILDVVGPDEYHERVNNNAYTSKMVYHTLDVALKTLEIMKDKYPAEYDNLISKTGFEYEIASIERFKDKLYVPKPHEKTLIIEQFDGYNRLEDCTLDEVRNRILDPKEYWGGGHGVASNTKIIKQADVALMLYLFSEEYSKEVLNANWVYYEPRTEHGSSLSPCIYSLLACEIGKPGFAYPFFVKSANIDLTGESKQFAGSIYIGGTHPASSGGAWMSAVLGFAGLNVKDGKIFLKPCLPEAWSRVAFKVIVRGVRYFIDITRKDEGTVHNIDIC